MALGLQLAGWQAIVCLLQDERFERAKQSRTQTSPSICWWMRVNRKPNFCVRYSLAGCCINWFLPMCSLEWENWTAFLTLEGPMDESSLSHLIMGFGSPLAKQSNLSSWLTLTAISFGGSLVHCNLTRSEARPFGGKPECNMEARYQRARDRNHQPTVAPERRDKCYYFDWWSWRASQAKLDQDGRRRGERERVEVGREI